MKVPVSWLRDLVDVPVATGVLASDLHMAGFEVASVDGDVIDFEITANRPDCLSLIGLAREVATRYGTALRTPATRDLGPARASAAGPVAVAIEDATRGPRYCAAVADVRIGPSPEWLSGRLTAAGIRAINNVVDVTNYVLLELGHPLHAFDLARLAGPALHVRTARPGEALVTLDGQTRTLDAEMLVIADAGRAQAVAGVMGGRDSEVGRETQAIVLESAWFLPGSVRRTSRRLGLSTEASYRFERGADIDAAPVALARACALIEQIGAGTIRAGWADAYPVARRPVEVGLEASEVRRVLGIPVEPAEVVRILTGLGFALDGPPGGPWRVGVPSWRVDVARDVDLVEEIARHHGYDRLPATFPPLAHVPPPPDPSADQTRTLRRLATATGFTEAVTFSFISEQAAREFADQADLVSLTNPLSELFAVLRPSMLPGLVDAVAHNRRHGMRDVRLFELGTRFVRGRGEQATLGLAWTGAAAAEHWSGGARMADLFDLVGAAETIAAGLGVSLTTRAATARALTPGRTAELLAAPPGGPPVVVGLAGQLEASLASARDIPAQDAVLVAEIDVGALQTLARREVASAGTLPRFPSIVRDLSVLVEDTLLAADVRGTIQAAAPPTLTRVAEFDRYQGKGIPDGRVSLSYRLTFQAPDRTLTDVEIDAAMTAIVAALASRHGAVRR